ncbi:DUF6369 family protein [Flavobacteriales bacterium]|nr:DUF6369 family protein [Flavobacteriales bacterium]
MSFTSFNGVYFYDYFFMFISVYYFFVLFESKIILKKNIHNIIIGLSVLVFYIGLAFTNSVTLDKYLLRDIRPFITLFYAFILSSLIGKEILNIKNLIYVLIGVFMFKIVFFLLMFLGFAFNDVYYQQNIYRYFDATTFISCLLIIFHMFNRDKILQYISKFSLNLLILLSIIIVLISNLRILFFALLLIYFIASNINLFKKIVASIIFLTLFIASSYLMQSDRVLTSNSKEIIAVQLASRFGPALVKINEMSTYNYITGLGLGTYFEIPWFEYRGLDTKLNTIDSTYLTLFVKYGLFSFLIIILFFRLLLFNSFSDRLKKSYVLFYLIVFLTMSSLYQSGTVFHFLFLNLLSISMSNESTTRSISIST